MFSSRDLYDELWTGRNLEIKNLWQRSIFLSAFLILVITGYGTLMVKVFEGSIGLFRYGRYSLPNAVHFAFIVLASLGMCLSILWIGMSKGSKFWYECYEKSIDEMVNSAPWNDLLFSKEYRNTCEKIKNNMYLCHGHLSEKENDQGLFSTDGGKYSVSRINILIGQIFFVLFILISFFHFIWLWIDQSTGFLYRPFAIGVVVLSFVLLIAPPLCVGFAARSKGNS
jgi:hypothetical protein